MLTTLICTVGGSHQPIVQAIESLTPDFVCFVCSDDDPATGRSGSYTQIQGRGHIIKADVGDDRPSLPNIPVQVGLAAERFEVIRVEPDDFDDVYGKVTAWLARRDRHQERIIADYTGGTKTMSAALVVAALDDEGVEVQLVTGRRDNLVRVESDGDVLPASVEATRFRRRLREALLPWLRFAYDESVHLLEALPSPRDATLRGDHRRALDLSRAFAAWDRFDHMTAQEILSHYRKLLGPSHGVLLSSLDVLVNVDKPGREPMQLFDLWRNAQRRAAQGRFDDAVARLYRLLEWSAQWLLREQAGIDTADVPKDAIPADWDLRPCRDGRYQLGLYQAWGLAAHHCGDELAGFWQQEQARLLNLLQTRNLSILAHGFRPMSESDWHGFSKWTGDRLLPLLLEITDDRRHYRIGKLPPQLPQRYPF